MNQTLEKPIADRVHASLRIQEWRIKDILDAIEANDASPESIREQIHLIVDSLRRVRLPA